MSTIDAVMYAGMIVWLGMGAYLFYLGKKQAALATRLQHMSQLEEE